MWMRVYRTAHSAAPKTTSPAGQVPSAQSDFTPSSMRCVFLLGQRGYRPTLLMQTAAFLPAHPPELTYSTSARGRHPGGAGYHLPALTCKRNLAVDQPCGPHCCFPSTIPILSNPTNRALLRIPDGPLSFRPEKRSGDVQPTLPLELSPWQQSYEPQGRRLMLPLAHQPWSGRSHRCLRRVPETVTCLLRWTTPFRRPLPPWPPCNPWSRTHPAARISNSNVSPAPYKTAAI